MNKTRCLRMLLLWLLLPILSACRTSPPSNPVVISAPTNPATAAALAEPRSFFADPRARQPGDMLTVVITEAASVAQSARTQADKTQSLTGKLTHGTNDQSERAGEIDSHYDGGGSIERKGKMVAKLAVRVVAVDDYGNLSIVGDQEILINNERQTMHLQGVVRPSDIDTDNTVLSWRVSGAKIALTGKGFLSRKQSPGPLSQLLSYFGL
jgi:flagellar L-ring protein precursor FlgH